jgi:hypothetical protein
MTTLKKSFTKNGFLFEQVERTGNVAIYRQTKPGQAWERFEVGRIRQNATYDAFGKHFEASESWPRSEEWGISAFTLTTLEEAQQKLTEMIDSRKRLSL